MRYLVSADTILTFGNAAVASGFAPAPGGYAAVWHLYENDSGAATRLGETTALGPQLESITIPAGAAFIRVDIRATDPDAALDSWTKPVHVYFRRSGAGCQLVGFDRMPDAPPMRPDLVGAEPIARAR